MNLLEVIKILEDALQLPSKRKELLTLFQKKIWEGQVLLDDINQIRLLKDLAYDLDFYESDPAKRAEDNALYDEKRLKVEISRVLTKLKPMGREVL